jgi:hypothetical protein
MILIGFGIKNDFLLVKNDFLLVKNDFLLVKNDLIKYSVYVNIYDILKYIIKKEFLYDT